MLLTARCLVAASLDGSLEFSVKELARRTRLTEDTVQRVMNSPTYQKLMREEMAQLVAVTMGRGIAAMQKIIGDDTEIAKNKIAAFKAIVATYDSMAGNLPREQESPTEAFEALVKGLRKQRVEVTNAGTGTASSGSEAQPGNGD